MNDIIKHISEGGKMMTSKKIRILSFLTCFVIILVSFVSSAYVISHIEHDCTGENCSVCTSIYAAEHILDNLGTGKITPLALTAVIGFLVLSLSSIFSEIYIKTLIGNKVRLNN